MKSSALPPVDKLKEFNEEYLASIQQPIYHIRYMKDLLIRLFSDTSDFYLNENTLYIMLDERNKTAWVHSVGLKPTGPQYKLLATEKSWSWQVSSAQYNSLLFFSGKKLDAPTVNIIVELCGCTQPEIKQVQESQFISSIKDMKGKRENAIENFSHFIAKKFSARHEKVVCQEVSRILREMNRLSGDGLTSHFIVLMYFYLDQYLVATNTALNSKNINLLIAASFQYVNLMLLDNAFDSKSTAEVFGISAKSLTCQTLKFLQVSIMNDDMADIYLDPEPDDEIEFQNPPSKKLPSLKDKQTDHKKVPVKASAPKKKLMHRDKINFFVPYKEDKPAHFSPDKIYDQLKDQFEGACQSSMGFVRMEPKSPPVKKVFIVPPTPYSTPNSSPTIFSRTITVPICPPTPCPSPETTVLYNK